MMSFIESFFASKVSENATKKLLSYNNGVLAYKYAAKIFILCGIGWMLMGIPAVIYQSVYWLWVLGIIQIVIGVVLRLLCIKSKKFQEWAKKDFAKDKGRFSKISKKRDMIACIISISVMAILFIALFIANMKE